MARSRNSPSGLSRSAETGLTGNIRFALGTVCGLVSALFLYAVSDLIQIGINRNEIFEILPTLLALLVAAVSLSISYYVLQEQRLMRQAGTDPVLIAYFDQREDAAELVIIRVSNVGAGAAMNVEIEILSDEVGFDSGLFATENIGLNPMRTIPQGDSVLINFGRGFELLKEPLPDPVDITLRYENIEGALREQYFKLDIRQIARLPAHRNLATRRTTATENIAENIKVVPAKLDSLLLEVTEMRREFRNWQKKS